MKYTFHNSEYKIKYNYIYELYVYMYYVIKYMYISTSIIYNQFNMYVMQTNLHLYNIWYDNNCNKLHICQCDIYLM